MALVKNLNSFLFSFFSFFFNLLTFSFSVFQIKYTEKVFHDVLHRKLAVLHNKNVELKKGQNLHLAKGVRQWFWLKICNFFILWFLDQIRLKTSFLMFQTENQPFQTIKLSNLKSGKHCIFAKGLVHSFGQKFQIFSFFVLQIKWDHKKSFITFQVDNQPFYTLKISNFKSGKTFIFAKG